MKKIILVLTLIMLSVLILTACGAENATAFSPSANYKTAIIGQQDGEAIKISVDEFFYRIDSDMVVIKSTDGKVYSTAWQNVVLIGEINK